MNIKKSDTQGQLYAALAKAQSQIGVAAKEKVNPAFGSRYVDLSAVLSAVLPAWNANGLAITQFPYVADGNEWIELTSLISHSSGEFLEHSMRMPVGGKRDAHAVGSATTYARRYSVAAIAGVIQDDDDGNLASQIDIARIEARAAAGVARAPYASHAKAVPAPVPVPVQAPAPEPDPTPVAARFEPKGGTVGPTEPVQVQAPAPVQAEPESVPEPEVQGEALNRHQLEFGIVSRSKKELNYELFTKWCEAHDRGVPDTWPLSKQKQALNWIEKGGWQAVRKWQAEYNAKIAKAGLAELEAELAAERAAELADKARVEDEVNESEQAQIEAKPKRRRRTKAEMEAYRAALAAGNIASDGGEE